MKNFDDLLTVQEVAMCLKVSDQTVYKLIRTNKLPAFKITRRIRVKRADLDKFIEIK